MRPRDAPRLVGWGSFPTPQKRTRPPGRSPNPTRPRDLPPAPQPAAGAASHPGMPARAKSRAGTNSGVKASEKTRALRRFGRTRHLGPWRARVHEEHGTIRLGRNGRAQRRLRSAGGLGVGMGLALSSAPVRSVGPKYEGDRLASRRGVCICMHVSFVSPRRAWRAYAVFMALLGAAIPSGHATPPHSALAVAVARFGWEFGLPPLSGHALRGHMCPALVWAGRPAGRQWKLVGLAVLAIICKVAACHFHLHT